MKAGSAPVVAVYLVLTKLFLAYSLLWALWPGGDWPRYCLLPVGWWPVVRDGCVLLAFPNTIRQVSTLGVLHSTQT